MTSLSILFVDDEVNILQGLKRMLHPHRQQWAMTFCSSGEEALKLLRERQFDVLVTDIRMPHVDGSRVLFESFLYQPETMRCILSGFAEREQTIKVAGTAHQFLSKPCTKDAIESMVQRAEKSRERLPQSDIRRAVSRVSAVPCRSSVLRELSSELQKQQPNLDLVVDLIASDIGMSAKIIQLVASSFFGRCTAVFCPREAVTLLGVELIAGLLSEMGIFTPFLSAPEILNIDDLCDESINAARLARAAADAQGRGTRAANVAYLSNYLREVGKIVLAHQFPEQYRRVMQLMKTVGLSQAVAEQTVFSATSASVGGYLLEIWGFPQEVVNKVAEFDAIDSDRSGLVLV
jgi:HD-like signal output (HDOD) protein/CheY-like chemotaxis protein